jgi:hypothetical protein
MLCAAERLRQAILKRAFEGKLVPQELAKVVAQPLLALAHNPQARVPVPQEELEPAAGVGRQQPRVLN